MTSVVSDPLLTLDQVGLEVGKKKRSVQGLIKSGALTAVKVGRSHRVRRSDLEKYIASLPAAGGTTPAPK